LPTGPTGYAFIGNGPTAATFQGFVQPGTGAVTRTWQNKAADIVSVLDFGAVGNGTTDDTAAIQAALNTGKNVYLPPGSYRITSGLSMVASGQRMYGEGGAGWLTIIEWDGASGVNVITISGLQHCIIESINIRRKAGSVNVTSGHAVSFQDNAYFCEMRTCKITGTGNGISMWGTGNQVIDCELREFSGIYGIRYFGTVGLGSFRGVLERVVIDNGLFISLISNASSAVVTTIFNHNLTTGNTVLISGVPPVIIGGVPVAYGGNGTWTITVLSPTTFSIPWNSVGYPAYPGGGVVTSNSIGFTHLIYDSYAHSLIIEACAFLWGGTAVLMQDSIGAPYTIEEYSFPTWLHAFDLECDHQSNDAIRLYGGEGCFLTTSWIGSNFNGNGIVTNVNWRSELLVTNSRIWGCAQFGVLLNAGISSCINNNVITLSSSQAAGYAGIGVGSGVSKFAITGNHITNDTSFTGVGATQAYGVFVSSGASDYYQVVGNVINGNTVANVSDGGTGTNKIVQNYVTNGGGLTLSGQLAANNVSAANNVAAVGQVSGGSLYINSPSGTAMQVVGSPSYALDFNSMSSTGTVRFKDGQNLSWNTSGGEKVALVNSSTNLLIAPYGQFGGTFIQTTLYPVSDNAFNLGGSANRWANVYAANGTIITSDPTLKTDISPLPTALPIIEGIDPVTFKWISGGKIEEKKVTKKQVPAPDGEGFVEEDVEEVIYVDRPGKRTHWGFLASDVKAAFDKTGLDFGGYVKDEEGMEHLRPDQLIPVLWKAIQELKLEFDNYKKERP
jgi:hypothetical protein